MITIRQSVEPFTAETAREKLPWFRYLVRELEGI